MSQNYFAKTTASKMNFDSSKITALATRLEVDEFDVIKPESVWPFTELVGCSMWHANLMRPDISNAVRAVARCIRPLKKKHWR